MCMGTGVLMCLCVCGTGEKKENERDREIERQTSCHSGKVTGGKVTRGVLGEKTKT